MDQNDINTFKELDLIMDISSSTSEIPAAEQKPLEQTIQSPPPLQQQDHEHIFPFLDLPLEIRTLIYQYHINPSHPSRPPSSIDLTLFDPTSSFPLSLLLTCLQIHTELRPLYYTTHRFSIQINRSPDSIESFLTPKFQPVLQSIRTLRVMIRRWGPRDLFTNKIAPVLEDIILNGNLRDLKFILLRKDMKTLYDLAGGRVEDPEEGDREGRSDGSGSGNLLENKRWGALKRVCQDPYLWNVRLGVWTGYLDDCEKSEENLKALARC